MTAPTPLHRRLAALGAALAALAAPADAPAQAAAGGGGAIYTCVDDKGRRLTSDRPIPECIGREQRVLNKDGSLRNVRPPSMTADERAEKEAAERQAAAERAARVEAVRRDRNLVQRYPDEPTHRQAREKALDTVREAIAAIQKRQAELAAERKPLDSEAEFYVGRALPAALKQQIDANDAAAAAQKSLAQNQAAELVRINAIYDLELERLKRLWAGAPPGSLGAMAAPPPAVKPASGAGSR